MRTHFLQNAKRRNSRRIDATAASPLRPHLAGVLNLGLCRDDGTDPDENRQTVEGAVLAKYKIIIRPLKEIAWAQD